MKAAGKDDDDASVLCLACVNGRLLDADGSNDPKPKPQRSVFSFLVWAVSGRSSRLIVARKFSFSAMVGESE